MPLLHKEFRDSANQTANAVAHLPQPAIQKIVLTHFGQNIILSAFVDATNLIESGRGTGPMKPRQPAEARSSVTRCQFQLEPRGSGKDEKSSRGFVTSSHPN
jgi:hypothetical protein